MLIRWIWLEQNVYGSDQNVWRHSEFFSPHLIFVRINYMKIHKSPWVIWNRWFKAVNRQTRQLGFSTYIQNESNDPLCLGCQPFGGDIRSQSVSNFCRNFRIRIISRYQWSDFYLFSFCFGLALFQMRHSLQIIKIFLKLKRKSNSLIM